MWAELFIIVIISTYILACLYFKAKQSRSLSHR